MQKFNVSGYINHVFKSGKVSGTAGALTYEHILRTAQPAEPPPPLPPFSEIVDSPTLLTPRMGHIAQTIVNEAVNNPQMIAPPVLALAAGAADRFGTSYLSQSQADRAFSNIFRNGMTMIPANPARADALEQSAQRNGRIANRLQTSARLMGPAAIVVGAGFIATDAYQDFNKGDYLEATKKVGGFSAAVGAGITCGVTAATFTAPYMLPMGPLGVALDVATGMVAGGLCASGADSAVRSSIDYAATQFSNLRNYVARAPER